jgi:NUMOD3 motif
MPKKGYKQTEEHKLKSSQVRKLSGIKPPSNLGKKFSVEHRQKISKGHMGLKHFNRKSSSKEGNIKRSIALRGENSSNWKGGITPLVRIIRTCFEYRQWRSDVFTRDGFMCSECGITGVYFEAHHKKRFSIIMKENNIDTIDKALICSELWDINNGITLCNKCHAKTKGVKKWVK